MQNLKKILMNKKRKTVRDLTEYAIRFFHFITEIIVRNNVSSVKLEAKIFESLKPNTDTRR